MMMMMNLIKLSKIKEKNNKIKCKIFGKDIIRKIKLKLLKKFQSQMQKKIMMLIRMINNLKLLKL
jgi:hypothetical protein